MRQRASIVMMVAALAAAACGRLGYQEREVSGDGGPPDARDGDGGGDLPDGGPGPGGCVGTLVVTTADDEADAGESPDPPHMGAGLSLREAIAIANDRDGLDCISFSGAAAIVLGSELPALEDPAGTAIDGDGVVSLASAGDVPTGLRLVSDNNQIYDLEIRDTRIAMQVNGSSTTLFGLNVHDCPDGGIIVAAASLETRIVASVLHDNRDAAIQAVGTSGLAILNCTVHRNAGSGIDATAGAADLFVENTLVTGNQDYGIEVDPGAATSIDFSDLSGNRLEDCLNCTPGPNSITDDPMYTSDLHLGAGSAAIDAGNPNGIDLNGDGSGDYNGLAPDMGAFESP
jgi:hypothetical protein